MTAMTKRFGIPLLAAFGAVALLSQNASAQTISIKDPMASETLAVFTKVCIITLGAPDLVAAKVVEFGATKLPDNEAKSLTHGKAASQGWKLATPHGAQLVVTLTPDRQCSVLVRRSDGQAIQDGLIQVLDKLASGGKMHFKPEHHDKRPRPGGTEETLDYLMVMPNDRDASVSATTTASTSADIQGLLTFTLLSKKN